MAEKLIKRGEIYWVDLPDSKGRELKEIHPCLVISNNKQNFASPLITVMPITGVFFSSFYSTKKREYNFSGSNSNGW